MLVVFVVTNTTVVNILKHVLVHICHYVGRKCPECEIAESKNMCIFHLERNPEITVQRVYTVLYIWKLLREKIFKVLITRKKLQLCGDEMLTKFVIVILQYMHISLCNTPKTNTMLFVSYISIKKEHISLKSQ